MIHFKNKITGFAQLTLVLLAGFVLTSCGGGGGSGVSGQQPASATSSLVVAKVDAAASPAIAVVMDNTGKEKIEIIGTKDSSGVPLSVTQGVYISASGEAGTITMGADGLPASLSDAVGDKTTFTNFTDNTMDITQFDPAGNKVAGPVTVNVDPTVLAKLRTNAVTLASSSTQGKSLVTGVFLGISTQDWVELSANDIGTAFGLVGCLPPVAILGGTMCVSTLVKAANDIAGTNRPLYINAADATAGVGADCLADWHPVGCAVSIATVTVPLTLNATAPPPTTPTGLTLLKVQQNQVIFSWTGSSDGYAWISGYRVYRDGNQIDDWAGTSYVDTKVIPGTRYCYTVAAHDANGKSSGVSDPLCVTIPVASLFVSSTTPVSGASAASISNPVFATFNGAIDASTLNASTFTVTGSSGLVTGTVSYNAVTQSAVFTPSANLAYAATYTASVTTGVKDLSGNPLASNYSWNFTTASNIGGGTAPLSFTVLNPASVSTSAVGYQPTLTASGANFSNLTQIRFDWSGVTSGSATWVKGTASWDPSKITVYSDGLMTLNPVVTQTGDPAGTTNWTVTLTDFVGATATKTFMVNYTPTTTITCTSPQVLTNGVCVTPTTNTFSISGSAGLSGVTMTLSGASSGGATSDANGNYTFGNLANGSYTVAPALSGYSFTPSSLVITVNGANITAANFTATSQSGTLYSITGTVTASGYALSGVTMTLSGANSGAYTTNANGQYGFALLANGSYTVTPTLSGYTFTPTSSPITVSGANVMGANFTGSATSTLTAPAVQSLAATSVTSTSAQMNASVNPNGSSTTTYFEYGTTTSYGSTTGVGGSFSGTTAAAVNYSMSGLSPNTTYHYRVVATNSGGTSRGGDVTFTTTAALIAPTVQSLAATLVTSTTAQMNGSINPNGLSTSAYFEYGTTTGYGGTTGPGTFSGTSVLPIQSSWTGLTPNTTYHYRAVATNSGGTSIGGDVSFTTAATPLVVNGVASSYFGTGQQTIPLTGSGFNSLNQISWSCANPNGTICTGSPYVWTPGTAKWGNVTITSDTVATVYPTFLIASDPAGTYNWSVTFSGGGQSVTKYFTAIK